MAYDMKITLNSDPGSRNQFPGTNIPDYSIHSGRNATKRIMVADDDPSILDSIGMVLRDENFHVDTVTNGSNIMEKAVDQRPDLILLDVRMSGVDGGDLCRALKSRAETRNIPVILISATDNLSRIAHAAGADSYMAKPFDIYELLSLVDKYVNCR